MVNRRGSATVLERANVQQQDPLGEAGWGTALWTEGQMKARKDFMLAVPPIGLHVINSSVADWQKLINISHGFGHKTKWVFASTRREQRDDVGYDRPTDIAIHPSSLADHLWFARDGDIAHQLMQKCCVCREIVGDLP